MQGSVPVPCEIKDLALAEAGKRRIEWAFQSMPVIASIRKHFIKTQVFAGIRIAACLPVSAEAANLMVTLRDGGGNVALCEVHPASTQDDIAASLVKDYGLPVFALHGGGTRPESRHLASALAHRPQLLLDHSGDLTSALLTSSDQERSQPVFGAIVQTRQAARRLRSSAASGKLGFPVLAAEGSLTWRVFHSRIGAGQSTLDTVVGSLNLLIAGLNVVIVGFGAAGRGVAVRARGLGANVIVTEVDPIRALEALMEGYRVLSIAEAALIGDLFLTVSGSRNVIGREHFDKLRNGAILCNAGPSNVEIDVSTLAQLTSSRRAVRESVEEICLRDGRRVYLVAAGNSIHSALGDNHPSAVLDLSFANQALSAEYVVKNRESLRAEIHPVALDIDRQVARLKLEAMGVKIDRLTVEQEQYLAGPSEQD